MDIKERQIVEKNGLATKFIIVCQLFMLASTIMYWQGRLMMPTSIMIVVQLCCIAFATISYIKFKSHRLGPILLTTSVCISYVVVLLGAVHTPYLYSFFVMMLLITMLYNNQKMINFIAIYCIALNILFIPLFYAFSPKIIERRFDVMTNTAFTILICLMAVFFVKLQRKHNGETIAEIEEKAAAQEQSAKQIEATSDAISEKLEIADDAMRALSEKVHASVEAIQQISESVTMTAEAIQTQTEMNSSITDSLENIADQSRSMSQNSKDVTDNINDGNELIKDLQAASAETSKINEETARMTATLQDTAETVKEIVATILGISSQTNLLALNASIEAARAGEAGKGFAVVADEIRQLSENTKTSAEEISSTIDDLITKVNTASANMEQSLESSTRQGEMIGMTGEKFALILESVTELADRVTSISNSVEECVSANIKVMDAISNLSASSEEVAASSESSITLSLDCENDMDTTKNILDDILAISRGK